MRRNIFLLVLVILTLLLSLIPVGSNAQSANSEVIFDNLRVSSDNISVGDEVKFSINATNTGNDSAVVNVEFLIDGGIIGSDVVSLNSSETGILGDNYTFEESDVYNLTVVDGDGNRISSMDIAVDPDEGDVKDFRFYIQSVSEGEVGGIDRDVNNVNYSGHELILMVEFDEEVNIRGHRFEKSDYVNSELYYSSEDLTEYHFALGFERSDNYTMRIEFYDRTEGTIRFSVSDANVTVVDADKFDKFEDHYYLNMRNLDEIEDIMGTPYPDDIEGVEGAYSDVIEDSRALRSGPVKTAQRLYAAGIFMSMSPYVILIVVMIFGFVSVKYRQLADPIRELISGESEAVNQEEMLIVDRLKRAKKRGDKTRIEVLSEYKNVPNVVSSKIKEDIPNIGKLRWVLGQTRIDENRFKGELKDLMFKWIKNYVKIADRDKGEDYMDKGIDPKEAFPEAIRTYVDFIVHDVGYREYSDYLDHYDTVLETISSDLDEEFDDDFREITNPESSDLDMDDLGNDGGFGSL